MDTWFKTFIWSGDVLIQKMCINAWENVCKPIEHGILSIRFANYINEALILNITWSFIKSIKEWAKIYMSRYILNNRSKQYHITSSIWPSKHHPSDMIMVDTIWVIDNDKSINY